MADQNDKKFAWTAVRLPAVILLGLVLMLLVGVLIFATRG